MATWYRRRVHDSELDDVINRNATSNIGDVDNHLKALFDGLNQIVFDDDSQITRCVVEKHTDKAEPRAEIEIEPRE